VKTAVTGGTGVVGRALVRHLVDQGHQVTGLARSAAAGRALEGLGATVVEGDVLDPGSLVTALDGHDWVFHVAGVNEMCSADPDYMDLVNIQGTRNVLAASRSAGVGRLIHTSSAAAIGEPHGTVGSETSAHRGSYLSRYERSKHLSERAVLEEADDLDVVVVNPSSVQGPGRATGTGRLLLDVLNGKLPFLVETTVSVVDIDDCSAGHLLAAERGRRGERYILSGASVTIGEALNMLRAAIGRPVDPKFAPGWLVSIGAGAVETGARVIRRHPPVCREMVRVLRAGHVYDGSRAVEELGLEYTPIETTIARTVTWFKEAGLLL
jgi:dihydroflavonol-4-reductase